MASRLVHGLGSARPSIGGSAALVSANTGERTLIPAIIPPGAAHVHPVSSAAPESLAGPDVVDLQVAVCTLLADFAVRSVPKGDIHLSTLQRLPRPNPDHPLTLSARLRTLRLNCVTDAYSDLWRDCFNSALLSDAWTDNRDRPNRPALGNVGPEWTAATPLRIAADRRQAQLEIDALVALMLGVTADELCTVYRTQFAVLYGYDHNEYTFDAYGRLVPNSVLRVWRAKGDRMTEEERTDTNQAVGNTYSYELPFGTLDREADMRRAYAEFDRRLAAMPTTSASSPITIKE